MRNSIFLIVFFIISFNSFSQDYLTQIIDDYLFSFYNTDSVVKHNGVGVKVTKDSLYILSRNGEIKKTYWLVDNKGKIIDTYIEISKKSLLVIDIIDEKKVDYQLYKRKSSKKVVLFTWNEFLEKTKTIKWRPDPKKVQYFNGGFPW